MSQTFKMQWDPVTKSYNTGFWNADQWKEFGKNGGIVTDDGELLLKDGKALNPYTDTLTNNSGLFGLGTAEQWGTAANIGGLAMKAFALPSQLNYYNTQIKLAKQQLAANREAIADRNKFNKTWANASNSVFSKGLAAQNAGSI